MALTPLVTEYLVPLLKDGMKIASMGYPDIVASESAVERWLDGRQCEYRDDAAKICKWHGMPLQRIPEAKSFFKAFGVHLAVYDLYETRGDELLCDLNYPWSENHYDTNHNDLGKYDFVLDVGTLEHCFNVAQAAKNMAELLNKGGIILHSNPFSMGNHGFYGLNPTWFHDFYMQDGFELQWCFLMEKGSNQAIQVPMTKRFDCQTDKELNIFAAAKRTEIQAILYPQQTKYVALAAAGNRA